MVGPKVNWKFAVTLTKDRTENGLSDLIDIGSCLLNVINGAFQTASMASSWNLKKILKTGWQIIHDSPARREDFMSVTSSSVFPLAFCATPWVENKSCRQGYFNLAPYSGDSYTLAEACTFQITEVQELHHT